MKAGLGYHESGVSGVDEWSKRHHSIIEIGRSAVSECATFSDFVGSDNENLIENRNDFDETESTEVADAYLSTSLIRHNQVSLERLISS